MRACLFAFVTRTLEFKFELELKLKLGLELENKQDTFVAKVRHTGAHSSLSATENDVKKSN